MLYLAHHPTEEHPEGQLLKEHNENVANITASIMSVCGDENEGYVTGYGHDVGKYSPGSQQRVRGDGGKVDHSTAGAYELYKRGYILGAMCVAGHHAGLMDFGTKYDSSGTFMARINKAKDGCIPSYSAWTDEMNDIPMNNPTWLDGTGNYFRTKMLFSALVEADWTDTDAYFSGELHARKVSELNTLRPMLTEFLRKFENPTTEINKKRCELLNAALNAADGEPGIYSLTYPTGSGKTISSMAFGLSHACNNDQERLIYLSPLCTILEQTQEQFEKIFTAENVLTVYSGAEYNFPEEEYHAWMSAAEDWDFPIVLTTTVQFFESIFSASPGRNRKLHNIMNSTIIIDEAQMLPVSFLRPCMEAISVLVRYFKCTVLLCTATQPALLPLLQKISPDTKIRELCPDPRGTYESFRRVRYVYDGYLSDEELAAQLLKRKQILCIVNNKRQAKHLYELICHVSGTFHLSTNMPAVERKRVLDIVRKRLRNGETCILVSTSLIEAGVDVDFPEVFRAVAGLDSIIQAGGRCNREGKRPINESIVHVFQTDAKAPQMQEHNIASTERVMKKYSEMDSLDAIDEYFDFLFYQIKDESQLDTKGIVDKAKNLMFETIAREFHIIEGADYVVYIPIGEGKSLLQKLKNNGPSRKLLRGLSAYGVNLYKDAYESMVAAGKVEVLSDNAGALLDMSLYCAETGLNVKPPESGTVYFA